VQAAILERMQELARTGQSTDLVAQRPEVV
jgi:hypothetical protein